MKRRFISGVLVLLCTLGICTASFSVDSYAENGPGNMGPGKGMGQQEAGTHGTTDEIIEESEVNNTPPEDYKIDETMQYDASEGEYLRFFPEDDLQTISISMDDTNLNYLLQNGDEKPSVMTTSVSIGDETIGYAGLKTKGNYTLEHTYSDFSGSDRYSFTINFGKYIKKKDYGHTQNFYGVQKISLNNFFFDKSMMKEYFALKLMTEMGVPTPAYALAKLYINDEYYGVYFMVESMDSSILERFYDMDKDAVSDYLIKVEDTNLSYDALSADSSPLYEGDDEVYEDVKDMLPTVLEWDRRLNCLSNGRDFDGNTIDVNSDEYVTLLKEIVDLDEELRYFAVHSFLVQLDDMFVEQHNYGLYVDENGVSQLIPWDYDLSFGCYFPSTAERTANYGLDYMFKTGFTTNDASLYYKDYPLFNVIYQNESLRKQYYQYMKDCSKISALGGTTLSGTSYEPGYFNSYIEKIQDKLIAAASEELPDHVSYLNFTSQPNDVIAALPNLSSIIAKRAVGVSLQADGIDSTVCGAGCSLETLGNASPGDASASGALTAVDDNTAFYLSGTYDTDSAAAPELDVTEIDETDSAYVQMKDLLGKKSDFLAYSFSSNRALPSGASLTIPLTESYTKEDVKIYEYKDGTLTPLTMQKQDDNLCTVSLNSDPQYIVIAKETRTFSVCYPVFIIFAAAVVSAIAGICARLRQNRAV